MHILERTFQIGTGPSVEESVSHQLLAFFDEVGLEKSGQFVNRVEYSN